MHKPEMPLWLPRKTESAAGRESGGAEEERRQTGVPGEA